MIPTQTLVEYPVFGNAACLVQPGEAKYSGGFLPADVLPAEWHNWFLNKASSAITCLNAGVGNVESELNYLLAQNGLQPDAETEGQVHQAVSCMVVNATARSLQITDNDATNCGNAVNFRDSTAIQIALPSTIKATLSGNASTATLATCAQKDGSGCSLGTAARYNCGTFAAAYNGSTSCVCKSHLSDCASCATDIYSPYFTATTCNCSMNIVFLNVGGASAACCAAAYSPRITTSLRYNPYGNLINANITGSAGYATCASYGNGGMFCTDGINSLAGNGLLTEDGSVNYWTGIANKAWGLGAVDRSGVIRTSGNDLLHYRKDTNARYTIWDSGNLTPGNYLARSGGTMTGAITMPPSQYGANAPLKMNNSDIKGANLIWFDDTAETGEGFAFKNSDACANYDLMRVCDGKLYIEFCYGGSGGKPANYRPGFEGYAKCVYYSTVGACGSSCAVRFTGNCWLCNTLSTSILLFGYGNIVHFLSPNSGMCACCTQQGWKYIMLV